MGDWRENLIESDAMLAAVLADAKRIAVLGIKTKVQRDRPAFYVLEYLAHAGCDIVPVPVGMVNVFRRSPAEVSGSSRTAESWSTTGGSAGKSAPGPVEKTLRAIGSRPER